MPPAIEAIGVAILGYLAPGACVVGGDIALAVGTGALAVGVGAEIGLSAALAPRAKSSISAGNQVDIRQAISYRSTILGTVRTGGVVTYVGTSGSNNDYLHMVITLSGHKLHAMHQNNCIYFDGKPITLGTPSGYYTPLTGQYASLVWIESENGDPTHTGQPFPGLAAEVGVTGWNATTSLQRGCAKVHVKLKWDATVFSSGVPAITFDVQGKEVYDPRTSTTGFSANPALLLRDYLTAAWGMRVDPSMVDDTATIAAANICDQAVNLRAGGTQPRYQANGVYTSDQERGKIIQSIVAAMEGMIIPPGDMWRMFSGAYTTSVMDITDSTLRGPIKIDRNVSRRDICNGIRGTYISPSNNWVASDFPAYQSSSWLTYDGNEPIWTDVAFDLETDPIRAQRRAKIELEKIRRKMPLTLPLKLKAFKLQPGDTVTYTHTRWGLAAATYTVAQTSLTQDTSGDSPVLGVDVVLYPIDANVYAWDPNVDEGTVTPCTSPALPDSTSVANVTGLTLLSDATTMIARADESTTPKLR